jgi:hypothetical protein
VTTPDKFWWILGLGDMGLTGAEEEALIFLEERTLNDGGRFNWSDVPMSLRTVLARWRDQKKISYGSLSKDDTGKYTHWVELDESAILAAHRCRLKRWKMTRGRVRIYK